MEKNEINWEDQYEALRSAHSHIKSIQKETLDGIPVWFGKERDLPKEYIDILRSIDKLLYKAESQVCEIMEE